MRILNKLLMLGLFIPMATILVACGDGNREPAPDSTVYTVTAPESDFYNVNGQTKSATAGIKAYVNIVPEFEAVKIDKVMFNGQECSKNEADENRYEFVMPAENVTITVDFSFIDNKTENFLTWDTSNEKTFEVFIETEDDFYYAPSDDGELKANVSKNPSGTDGYFTNHDEEAFSTNQNVVPNEALSVSATTKSLSNSAISFTVNIDRTKIHAGTTQIILKVDNNHKFGDASLLVCTITVTESTVA